MEFFLVDVLIGEVHAKLKTQNSKRKTPSAWPANTSFEKLLR